MAMSSSTYRSYSKEICNPNGIDLTCPHCESRDFHYHILSEFTVFFSTPNDNIEVYEREPGDTKEFESIYCSECGKRAFTRKQLEKLGVNIPA